MHTRRVEGNPRWAKRLVLATYALLSSGVAKGEACLEDSERRGIGEGKELSTAPPIRDNGDRSSILDCASAWSLSNALA